MAIVEPAQSRVVGKSSVVPRPAEVKSALVVFSRGLGDHILTLPALRALGRLFPGKLQLIVSRSAPDLFFGDAGFRRILDMDFDFSRKSGRLFDVASAAEQLGEADLFLSVIPGSSEEWAQLSDILQPQWSIGYASGFARQLPLDLARHAVDQAFAVPRGFQPAFRPEDFSHPFPLPAESVKFAQALRGNLGNRRLMVIHAETKPYKQWKPDQFRETLANFFAASPEYIGVEICQTETMLGDPVPPGVMTMSGLPLASAIALAAAADLLLCVDSMFLHVADLWRTPTVALFGPTDPNVWGARFNSMCRHAKAEDMESLSAAVVGRELKRLDAEIKRCNYKPKSLSPLGHPDLLRWA
jgi:ADP-heptose:LPS heptosyltransferase